MEQKWSKKFEKCCNCNTDRFQHRAKGFCTRCYPLQKRLEQIALWNFDDPSSLKGYPQESTFYRSDTFSIIKPGIERQIKSRLYHLKHIEEQLSGTPSGLDLEYKLREIANLAGARGDVLFFHSADRFDHYFDTNQKKILMKTFIELLEDVRWKGIDWWEVFNTRK